jgi:putative Holliday junction resolvase
MSCAFGFDYGSRLIGVAVGNHLTASARGIAAIPNRDGTPDWVQLDSLRQSWLPDTLVVGLPLTLEGEEQPASRAARRFANQLSERYNVPVVLVDERHTSQEAARRFAQARAAGLKRKRDAQQIDAEAAAVILEGWLTGMTEAMPGVASP